MEHFERFTVMPSNEHTLALHISASPVLPRREYAYGLLNLASGLNHKPILILLVRFRILIRAYL